MDHIELCYDCQVAMVDEPPRPNAKAPTTSAEPSEPMHEPPSTVPELREWTGVFTSGNQMEAEIVRGVLASAGFEVRIWGSGLGSWTIVSALTDVSTLPNAFNAYRVVVPAEDHVEAKAVLKRASRRELEAQGADALGASPDRPADDPAGLLGESGSDQ